MMQAVMESPGNIKFRQVNIPELHEDQVLIKIKRIGICGSDIHVYHGKHPFTTYPVVQGHEVSGEVVITGANVSGFKKGDRVTIQPQITCGQCLQCKNGCYHICDNLKVMGFQDTGMASEFFAVDRKKLHKLPGSMSFDKGALIEPLAVAFHAIRQSCINLFKKNIIVFGAGPIGNLVAQTAKAMGANSVMITDISQFRLDLARQCGIDYTVNVQNSDIVKAVEDFFGPEKADLILDCAGNQNTIRDAVKIARKGTEIIIVAVIPNEIKVELGLVQDRELKIIGTLMYDETDYTDAIKLIQSKDMAAEKIITDYFEFADYDKAYNFIEDRKDLAMKVMVKMPD